MRLTESLVSGFLYCQEILEGSLIVVFELVRQYFVYHQFLVYESYGKPNFGFSHLIGCNLWHLTGT